MQQRKYQIKGVAPLLMHAPKTVDPLSPEARAMKKISAKKTKTEDDHAEMMRIEFLAGLYWRKDVGFFLPGDMIAAALKQAARLTKKGKDFERYAVIFEPFLPFRFGGDTTLKTPEQVFEHGGYVDRRDVKVGAARVIRTRPRFDQWSTEFVVGFESSKINAEDIDGFVASAGQYIGLGDKRPSFGRFARA